jgi:hypothetical protein
MDQPFQLLEVPPHVSEQNRERRLDGMSRQEQPRVFRGGKFLLDGERFHSPNFRSQLSGLQVIRIMRDTSLTT